MNQSDSQHELLLRYFDGRLTAEEKQIVTDLLRTDHAARAFLREVSEQAVLVADIERTAAGRQEALQPQGRMAEQGRKVVPVNFRAWQWRSAAALVIALLIVAAFQLRPEAKQGVVRVSKLTGSSQYFGSKGGTENALRTGSLLGIGDTLESRSCDAWIELKLRDDSTITIVGHSTLRILKADSGSEQFVLLQGTLWGSPAPGSAGGVVSIQTPTLAAELRGAQFDIQTSATETMLRVNDGVARVRQNLDGSSVELARGQRVASSLNRKAPLIVTAQPSPINYWSCDLWRVPEVILGRWLPPRGNEQARLRADPLLWPIPDRDPLMLYAVAVAAWKSTEHPVLLQSDSKLRVRGRTERAQMVRFGFSTQKMRGVFSGKFEVDVPPEKLGTAGETWEIELPLSSFRSLQPQLSASPDGLELTDIYALTIKEDAGLEINHVELVPKKP